MTRTGSRNATAPSTIYSASVRAATTSGMRATSQVTVDEEVFEAREPLPRCIRCGEMARPNILMFGDWSWNGAGARSRASGWRSG